VTIWDLFGVRTIREEYKMLLGKRVLSTSTAILLAVVIATFAWSGMAAAESEEYGTELQNYFSNANAGAGTAYINITAPLEGAPTATAPYAREGELCAMIYVFNTEQSLQACCGCPLTADGLLTLNISTQVAVNAVTGGLIHDGSVRIISSLPNSTPAPYGDTQPAYAGCDSNTSVCCDPTAAAEGFALAPTPELIAWGDHIQTTQITETIFQADVPGTGEITDPGLGLACADVVRLGSLQGTCICPAAQVGYTATAKHKKR
jgi:hypothetical protein